MLNRRKMRGASKVRIGTFLAAAVTGLGLFASESRAATWSSTPTNANWNSGPNWSPAFVPNPGGDLLFFNDSTISTLNNDLPAGYNVNGIIFNSGMTAYTFNGNSITLQTGGIANFSTISQTVNLPLIMPANAAETFDTTGGALVLGGPISGGQVSANAANPAIIHTGEGGPLVLSSTANTFQGAINARTGTVSITGVINSPAIHNIGDTAGDSGFLSVDGGTLISTGNNAPQFRIGNSPNAAGAVYLNSGVLNVGNTGGGEFWLGASTASYGAYIQNGGQFTIGAWLAMARGTGTGSAGMGFVAMNGGTMTVLVQPITVGSYNAFSAGQLAAVMVINGGVINSNISIFAAENVSGQITMNGGVVTTPQFGIAQGGAPDAGDSILGEFTMNGGTLTTNTIMTGGGVNATHRSIMNFNGGLIKARAANQNIVANLTNAIIWPGGLSINDQGFNTTIAAALTAPTGNGLTGSTNDFSQMTLAAAGGGVFAGPPLVDIQNGGFGSGATAVANLDSGGNLTSVTITNPGFGYLGAPIVNITGGGNFGFLIDPIGMAPNSSLPSGGLTKTGAGVLSLTRANTYGGSTAVSGGLNEVFSAAVPVDILPSTTNTTFNGGVDWTLNSRSNQTASQTIASLTINAGPNTVTMLGNGSNNFALSLGAITRNIGSVLTFNQSANQLITTTNSNVGGILGGYANVNGVSFATISGGSVQSLSSYSTTFTATTNVDPGATSPSIGTVNVNALRFSDPSSQTVTESGVLTLATGGLLVSNAVGINNLTMTGGTLTSGAVDLVIFQANTAGALTIASKIAGTQALTIGGSGTVALTNAANSFTGKEYLDGGILHITSDTALGPVPASVVADQIRINGGTLQLGAAFSLSPNRGITLDTRGGALATSGANSTYAGVIAGNGTFVKAGAGMLTLSGVETYTGPTIIRGGTINLTGVIATDINSIVTVGDTNPTSSSTANFTSVLSINGGTLAANKNTSPSLRAAQGDGAFGLIQMNTGVLSTTERVFLGGGVGGGGFAAMDMVGGTVNLGSFLVVGQNNDRAVVNLSGGVLNTLTNFPTIGAGGFLSIGVMNVTGGTLTSYTNGVAANADGQIRVGENGFGVLEMRGGVVSTAAQNATVFAVSGFTALSTASLRLGESGNLTFGSMGIVNLIAGTLSINRMIHNNASSSAYINFNGGLLVGNQDPGAANAFIPTLTTFVTNTDLLGNITSTQSGYGQALVWAGGARIDTNNNGGTIFGSTASSVGFSLVLQAPLEAPTDSGVTAVAVATGSGYLTTPVVQITGGGGTGATAIANLDGLGNLTGITVTNPGIGYGVTTDAPIATVYGGGGTISATDSTLTLTSNVGVGGGLTKLGLGTLTLSHSGNNYRGVTNVNGGVFNVTGALTTPDNVVANSGGTVQAGTSQTGIVNNSIGTITAGSVIANSGGTVLVTGLINAPVTINGGGALSGTGNILSSGTNSGYGGGVVTGLVTVAGGTTAPTQGSINLNDNRLSTLTLTGGLVVGGGSAGQKSILAFEFGGAGSTATQATTDSINLGSSAFTTNAGGATVLITNLGVIQPGQTGNIMTYTNSVAPTNVALDPGSAQLGLIFLNLNANTSRLQISVTGAATPTTAFWAGNLGANWNSFSGTSGSNWRTGVNNNIDTSQFPGPTTNVVFGTSTPGTTNLNNTLGQGFDVNSVTITGGLSQPVIIGGTNVLTIETGGLTVGAGPGLVLNSAMALGGNQTWTNNSATPLQVNNVISSLNPATLTLTGSMSFASSNTFTGKVIITKGTFTLSPGTTVGGTTQTSAFGSFANPLQFNSVPGGGVLSLNGQSTTVGGLSGNDTLAIIQNTATSNATFTVSTSATGSVSTFAGTLQDGGSGQLALTLTANSSANAGQLTLTAVNQYSGATQVNGGTLVLASGSAISPSVTSTVGNGASNRGVMVINGGTVTQGGGTSLRIGYGANNGTAANPTAQGALVMNGGILTTAGEIWIGNRNGTYGALLMNNGTLTSGSWFAPGRSDNGVAGVGVVVMTGGEIDVLSNQATLGSFNNGGATDNVLKISVTFQGGLFHTVNNIWVGENVPANVTMMNNAVLQADTGVTLAQTQGTGRFNLNGGTLITPRIIKGGGVGNANFNGALIKASTTPAANFITGIDRAVIWGGNAVIDDGGQLITVPQSFSAPTGNGITAITLSTALAATSLPFIAPPLVSITGGGGIDASAIATLNPDGTLAGITMTNPGTGYTSKPTVAIIGGGATLANFPLGNSTVTLSPNPIGGGITKQGAGTMVLSGISTYLGTTTVQGGKLAVGANANLGDSAAPVLLDNGTLEVTTSFKAANGTSNRNFSVSAAGGSIFVDAFRNLGIAGNVTSPSGGALNFTGPGTVTLGDPTFNGTMNVNAGILRVTSILDGTGNVAVNSGGGLGGTGTVNKAVIVSSGGLVNLVDNAAGTLTMGANLTINGGGLRFDILSGANDRLNLGANQILGTGGTVGVGGLFAPAGTYTLASYTNGAPPALTLPSGNIGTSTAVLNVTNTTMTLTITGNAAPGQAWWKGTIDSAWGSASGPNTNWNSTQAGGLDAGQVPGPGTQIFFVATGGNTNLGTTLGGDVSVDSVTVKSGAQAVSISGTQNNLTLVNGISAESGSNGLTVTANLVLAGPQTFKNSATAATVLNGGVLGTGPLTIDGNTVLNNNNIYTGGTVIKSGVVILGSQTGLSLANSNVTFSAGSNATLQLMNGAGNGVNGTNSNIIQVGLLNGDSTAIIENSTGSAVTARLEVGGTTGTSSFAGIIRDGNGGGTTQLRVTNGATLTLSGNNVYNGQTRIDTGVLNLVGPAGHIGTGNNLIDFNNGGTTSSRAVLNIGAGASIDGPGTGTDGVFIRMGNNAATGAASFLNMTGGNINTGSAQILVGRGNNGQATSPYSGMAMSGGQITAGSWFAVGFGNDQAIFNHSGGTILQTRQFGTNAAANGGSSGVAQWNASGTSVYESDSITGGQGLYVAEFNQTIMTISGNAQMILGGANGLRFNVNGGAAGIFNLDGGTVTTSRVFSSTGTSRFNFHGGRLVASTTDTGQLNQFMGSIGNGTTISSATIWSEGAFIDDAGQVITVASNLLAPINGGIGTANTTVWPINGGGGYIGPPVVTLNAFSTNGGATAVANIDGGGNLTSITVTNPGSGYFAVPTATFAGGGGTMTSYSGPATGAGLKFNNGTPAGVTLVDGFTLSANTNLVNLTKLGTGTLVLAGAATAATQSFAGTLVLTAGVLRLAAAGAVQLNALALPANSLNALTFDQSVASHNFAVGAVNSFGGTLTTTDAALNAVTLSIGNNTANYATTTFDGVLSGIGGLAKIGTGTLTVTKTQTYTGTTTAGAGVLNFSGAAQNLTGLVAGTASMNINANVLLAPTVANTMSGTVALQSGSLTLANSSAANSMTISQAAPIANQLRFDSSVASNVFTIGGLSGSGTVTLANNAGSPAAIEAKIGNNNVANTFSGLLTGGGSLTKVGTGVFTLTGTTNNYTGPTTVLNGALHADGRALSLSSNTVLNGGLLEIGDNFTRSIGTGAAQIQIPGGTSGFSANGTANVNLSLGALVWGATGSTFGPTALVLQSSTANRTLTLTSNVDLNNTQDIVQVNSSGVANAAMISGNITGAGTASGLTKAGGGYLILTGVNTNAGNTTVVGGVLRAEGTALSGNANLVLNGGIFERTAATAFTLGNAAGQVQITGGTSGFSAFNAADTTGTNAITFTLGGAGPISFGTTTFNPSNFTLQTGTSNEPLLWSTALDLNNGNRNLTVNPGANTLSNATITSTISNSGGSGNLTKLGTGTLIITGAVTYTTPTVLNAGVVNMSGATNQTLNSAISGAGSLVANNAQTLTLSKANVFTGSTTVIGGKLLLSNSSALNSSTLSMTGNATGSSTTLLFDSAVVSHVFTMGGLTGGGTVTLSDLGSTAVNLAVGNNNAANTFAGVLAGSGSITKVGTGAFTLSNTNNSYAGSTAVLNGTLHADGGALGGGNLLISNSALELGGNFARNLGSSAGQVQVLGGGTSTFSINGTGAAPGTITIGSAGSSLQMGSANFNVVTLALQTGTANRPLLLNNGLDLNNAARTVTVAVTSAANLATISGVISDSGTGGSLIKTGSGYLALTGANTYSDPTIVNGGVLQANSGAGLPTNSALTLQNLAPSPFTVLETSADLSRNGGSSNGQIQILGGVSGFSNNGAASHNVTISGGATLIWGSATFNAQALVMQIATSTQPITLTNGINLNNVIRTLAVFNTAASAGATISGIIMDSGGSGAINKSGNGYLTLSGVNTYVGQTQISGGVLHANDGVGLPFFSNLNLNGGVLETSANITRDYGTGTNQVQMPYPGTLTGTGSGFSANGGSPVTVSITNTPGGALLWGSSAADVFAPLTLILNDTNANQPLTFADTINLNNGYNGTVNGALTPSLGQRTIAVNSALFPATISGAIVDSGTNSTFVKSGAGTLILTGGATYGGPTSLAGGTLAFAGDTTSKQTLVNVVSGAGGLFVGGTGTVVLGAANNFSGNTAIGTGTLLLSNSSAVANSTLVNAATGNVLFSNSTAGISTGIVTVGSGNGTVNVNAPTFVLGGLSGAGGVLDMKNTGITGNPAGVALNLRVGNNNANTTYSGTLVGTGTGQGSITKIGTGNTTLAGAATYGYGTVITSGTLTFAGGVTHSVGAISGAGSLFVTGASTILNSSGVTSTGAWSINASSSHNIIAGSNPLITGPNTSKITSATNAIPTIAGSGTAGPFTATLNLTNNALIVQTTNISATNNKATTINQLDALINSGSAGATWTGKGITSSTAAGNPTKFGVGIFDNGIMLKTQFAGQSVDTTSVFVAIAHLGDANRDGITNIQDISIVANNFGTAKNNWSQGDMNRDGTVNIQDFSIVANNWQQTSSFNQLASGLDGGGLGGGGGSSILDSSPTPAESSAPSSSGSSSSGGLSGGTSGVPEPTSLGLLALGGAALLVRRRRR